jgi:3-deoxy-7-phosphoheptulonate synthase
VTPQSQIRNQRILNIRPLDTPGELRRALPLSMSQQETVLQGRQAVVDALNGLDDRLLVIVGPCSLHDPVAGLEYAERLAELNSKLSNDLLIVMRTYFEKPRTIIGWKGLINDPHLDGTFRINDGLHDARSFLLKVLDLGLPVGCEFLDPITTEYLADTVSWGAIGARTTQSQIHRQMASGLSMPIGFKNPIDGDIQGAIDAVSAASVPQAFPGIDEDGRGALFETSGNADGHVVLRGSTAGPNFDAASVVDTLDRLEGQGLPRRVIIDASHANSGKDHHVQPEVAASLARRLGGGEQGIAGVMLESFLIAGRQDFEVGHTDDLIFGQSITDACIGWDTTITVLEQLASAVVTRGTRSGALVTN